MGGREVTDIDNLRQIHHQVAAPFNDSEDICHNCWSPFPCGYERLASELEAARKVVDEARLVHASRCDCDLCISVTAYERVMEEQR